MFDRRGWRAAGGSRIRCPAVSFGRRLALFLVAIAVVPTLALIGILLFVSEDSQRGKADARLAAGVRTATAIYRTRTAEAAATAQQLAKSPDLGSALRANDGAAEQLFAQRSVGQSSAERVSLYDNAGTQIAAAGQPNSVAFARV